MMDLRECFIPRKKKAKGWSLLGLHILADSGRDRGPDKELSGDDVVFRLYDSCIKPCDGPLA